VSERERERERSSGTCAASAATPHIENTFYRGHILYILAQRVLQHCSTPRTVEKDVSSIECVFYIECVLYRICSLYIDMSKENKRRWIGSRRLKEVDKRRWSVLAMC